MNTQQHNPVLLAAGGMLAMAAAMGIGRFVYTPILPMMVEQVGLSKAQAGMIASSNFLGYLLGAMIAASNILHGSPRRWLLGALLASALSTSWMAVIDSYAGFLGVRFIGGLVSSWVLVFASTLVIERLARAGRGKLTAILFAGVGVGIVIASLVSAAVVAAGAGWRHAWLYSGLVAVAATVCVALLVPDRTEAPAAAAAPGDHAGAGLGGLIGAYALFGFGYVITATFIVQLVRDARFSMAMETWIWVLTGLAAVPSIWLWNRLATALGNSRTFGLACLLLAIGVACSVLMVNIAGLIVAALLLGGTFMGITALGLVEARQRSVHDPRRTLAMMTAGFGVGQIIGPTVAGYLVDSTGSFLIPSMLAVVALLLAAALAQYR